MKKGFLSLGLICFLILGILPFVQSALGISPAVKEIDFTPGFNNSFNYKAIADKGKEIIIYAEGDLAEYVSFDITETNGSGNFKVNLNFPNEIDKPGKHRIFIVLEEKVDEELATLGTRIIMKGVIKVYVPYPGKYLEITSFKSNDVNTGEEVIFKLDIKNFGKETLSFIPKIGIKNQEENTLETLFLKERTLNSHEEISLVKSLDTTNYNPGTYIATAIIDYGKIAKKDSTFRIGNLAIKIIAYTEKIIIKGIQKFELELESGWNDKVDGVYAEVDILNGSQSLINFKTSSTNLAPWESKTINGFFDTTNITQGIYDANITLFYYGKDVGKSSGKLVKIEFIEPEKSKVLIVSIIMAILGLIIGIIIIIWRIKKNGKKKK